MDETIILRQVRDDIHRTGILDDTDRQLLTDTFLKRYSQACELMDGGKVTKYVFKPSKRTIWVVTGKHEQQVLPESAFCTCDDYYFRVMSGKKQVCYHIVAQLLAEALGKYRTNDLSDQEYSQITSKWTIRAVKA